MKWAIFEEHSSSCVVYSRFSGTLFPVSMIDGVNTCFHLFTIKTTTVLINNQYSVELVLKIVHLMKSRKNVLEHLYRLQVLTGSSVAHENGIFASA